MHVCTPLESHVSVAEEAIALGAHVVVEKPMTADAASTDALLAAAQARGVLAVPVHQFLFQPGVQRLLAARSRYGSLVRCVFEAATAGAEVTGLDRDELVADILPHPLALFSRLTSSGTVGGRVASPSAPRPVSCGHSRTSTERRSRSSSRPGYDRRG